MKNIKKNKIILLIFSIYYIIGLYLFNDYGIGIEEHFQRQNGFFWLKHILENFQFKNLALSANNIFLEIRSNDPSLPNPDYFNFYGIIFDVPLAFLEIILENKEIKFFFEIRHLINFTIFFISSIYFFKILKRRFNTNIIIYIGLILYICSPRIFGDSFHNNKDILFLSFLTISIFYLFRIFEKNKLNNIIFFSLFTALAISTRIMGVYLPLLYFFFLFFEYFSKKINLNFLIKKIIFISFFLILFLYLHYPYIWELRLVNLYSWFNKFFYNMDYRILFNGEYYNIKYLPRFYLLFWISSTIPLYILILFLLGFFLILKRFYFRILAIQFEKVCIFNDFWRSTNEKKDLFIFISLSSFLIYAIFFNVAMLSGWRHLYFLHIFIIYISTYGLNIIYLLIKKKLIKIKLFLLINISLITYIFYQIYIYHPYQSLYFNNLLTKKYISNFPIDTPSLSRVDALKFIISDGKNLDKISVANASWTPLHNGKDLLYKKDYNKIKFVGQDYNNADYIYTNFIYEINPKLNNKYHINNNYKVIKEFNIKNINIYKIYKKKNK